MRSAAMLSELEDAAACQRTVSLAMLRFFIDTGSFKVRQRIFHLIRRHSSATSSLAKQPLFDFLISYLDEEYWVVPYHIFNEGCRVFLHELSEYCLLWEEKAQHIERFLEMISRIVQHDPGREDLIEITVIDALRRSFPEAEDLVRRYLQKSKGSLCAS